MTNPFVHIVFTRYNVKGISSQYLKDKHKSPTLTLDWYNERFELFSGYCLPSFINQKCKNFRWVIFMDSNTPQVKFFEVLEAIKGHTFIQVLKVSGVEEMVELIHKISYHHVLGEKKEYLITSRIDNDDMIHCNMISEIQNLFNYQDRTLISTQRGYTYSLDTGVLFKAFINRSPFLSMIEKVTKEELITVFIGSHMDVKNEDIIFIPDKRLWCQIIHGKNLVNIHSGRVVWRNDVLNHFALEVISPDKATVLKEYIKSLLFTRPYHYTRNLMVKLITKIKK
jgi:hypothetical protein